MLQIGQQVRVLEPFTRDFPDVYDITDIHTHDDGQVVYILGDAGGFDLRYLETI